MLALAIIATIIVGEGLLGLFAWAVDVDNPFDTWLAINAFLLVIAVVIGGITGVVMLWMAV